MIDAVLFIYKLGEHLCYYNTYNMYFICALFAPLSFASLCFQHLNSLTENRDWTKAYKFYG